jgi:hypothetical protein
VRKRQEPLLRAGDAAEYLGVTIVTLPRMEKEDALAPYRMPGGGRSPGSYKQRGLPWCRGITGTTGV